MDVDRVHESKFVESFEHVLQTVIGRNERLHHTHTYSYVYLYNVSQHVFVDLTTCVSRVRHERVNKYLKGVTSHSDIHTYERHAAKRFYEGCYYDQIFCYLKLGIFSDS